MSDIPPDNWPEIYLCKDGRVAVEQAYTAASVILEYGCGGSTALAASMPGKLVFSVESDFGWANKLQNRIYDRYPNALVNVYYSNIGPVGAWGRPLDNSHWTLFHKYATSIWDEDFFLHPDVVLIDGRFRAACMMTTLARIERPVTILFDDYNRRTAYHVVEKFIKPDRLAGRMAIFEARPGLVSLSDLSDILCAFTQASFHDKKPYYRVDAKTSVRMRRESFINDD